MKQVKWTKQLTENFIDLAMLSDDEAYIMRSRVKGSTITQQAIQLNKSEATIHRMVRSLKHKYDIVQKEHPDVFPIRIHSVKEDYMDNH